MHILFDMFWNLSIALLINLFVASKMHYVDSFTAQLD
jgi:hypothetical protein